MAKKGKQLRAALDKIDSTKAYSVEEAVALSKELNFAKLRTPLGLKKTTASYFS